MPAGLGSAGGPGVPAMGSPGPTDEATYGDDDVSEIEKGVDDIGPAFVAARQSMEGVLPGVRALDMPPLTSLVGAFSPLCVMRPCRLRALSSARVLSES